MTDEVKRTPPPGEGTGTPQANPMTATTTEAAKPVSLSAGGNADLRPGADIKPKEDLTKPVQHSSQDYYYDRDQGAHMKLSDGKPATPLVGNALFEASRKAEEEARKKPPLLSKGPESVSADFASSAGDSMVKGVAENLTIAEEDAALLKERQPESSARVGAASSKDIR